MAAPGGPALSSAAPNLQAPRPLFSLELAGVPVLLLADSGAKCSCIRQTFLLSLQEKAAGSIVIRPSAVALSGAGGGSIASDKVAWITVVAGDGVRKDKPISWPFFVVPDLCCEVLAGVDLLAYLGATLDIAKAAVLFSATPQDVALLTVNDVQLPPFQLSVIAVRATAPLATHAVGPMVGYCDPTHPMVLEGAVKIKEGGTTHVLVGNPSLEPQSIPRGCCVGTLLPMPEPAEWVPVDQLELVVGPLQRASPPEREEERQPRAMEPADKQALLDKLQLQCPPEWREKYEALILEFADVCSVSDMDMGKAKGYEHVINLSSPNPVHVKQFRVPMAQHDFVRKRVAELHRLGLLERSDSPYNTPIFAVPKKSLPGEPIKYRLIQDLRALNEVTLQDKHTIADVRACLDRVGQLKAKVFSSLDLNPCVERRF